MTTKTPTARRRPGGAAMWSRSGVVMVTEISYSREVPYDVGTVELRARLEALTYIGADLAECYSPAADVTRYQLAEQRAALEKELRRRERLHAAGADVPNPSDATYDAWLALAHEVRERADILAVFADAGCILNHAGWSNRRQAEELAGPCPWCGGSDRFRVWRGAHGGYWCRQCNLSGDVITATRNLIPGCSGFFAALVYLARNLGLSLPATVSDASGRPSRLRIEVR